jgi:hypothetical protein
LGGISNLPLSVSDFIYLRKEGILFLAVSDFSLFTKLDDLLGNFAIRNNPDKKSSLIAYKEVDWSFKQLWKKDFSSNVRRT